jgi:hypothetical protein
MFGVSGDEMAMKSDLQDGQGMARDRWTSEKSISRRADSGRSAGSFSREVVTNPAEA